MFSRHFSLFPKFGKLYYLEPPPIIFVVMTSRIITRADSHKNPGLPTVITFRSVSPPDKENVQPQCAPAHLGMEVTPIHPVGQTVLSLPGA